MTTATAATRLLRSFPKLQAPRVDGFSPSVNNTMMQQTMQWLPALIGWGVFAGGAVLFLGERTPLLRRDVFSKLPVLGDAFYAAYRVKEEEPVKKD